MLNFSPSSTEQCVNVPTTEDTVFEPDEQFFATLTGSAPRLTLSPREATVTILNDDG